MCCALGTGTLGGGSRERHLASARGRAGRGTLLSTPPTACTAVAVQGGLRELRDEIADLEGKILKRLGSGRASPSPEASHSTATNFCVCKHKGSFGTLTVLIDLS